jgi:hypothetical protein
VAEKEKDWNLAFLATIEDAGAEMERHLRSLDSSFVLSV